MSWIFKPAPLETVRMQTKSTMSELRKVDSRTNQIYTEILPEEAEHKLGKYQDWSRVKIESVNSRDIVRRLRETSKHFVDPDFPHSNSMLSRDFFSGEIEWVRVAKLIDNAVYCRQQNRNALQNIRINRPAFEKALVLIARTSPSLYKELLSKTLSSEGLYQFKLFTQGYIQNVVIDDYIPTHEGLPIFVGPVRQNQVYAMLLEKALAKACGSYQAIPDQAEEILEMIFCGPVNTSLVSDLRDSNILGEKIRSGLQRKQLTVLMSKRDHKIRNYGLNDNEVYLVINHYEIEWAGMQLKELQESKVSVFNQSSFMRKSRVDQKKSMNNSRGPQEQSMWGSKTPTIVQQSSVYRKESNKENKETKDNRPVEHVYQCISESKLSAWNGRFSLNDEVWGKMDVGTKAQLYKQIQTNHSFLINQVDIARLFQEVMIFETNETNNKDWVSNQSHNNMPSFTRFEVNREENVFIRVTAPSKIKQTVILAKEIGGKQYEYISSQFLTSTAKVQMSALLGPGKYVLVVYHQWYVNKSGSYFVFLSSQSHIRLTKGGLLDQDFLIKTIISLETQKPLNAKEDKEECTIRLELDRLGLAYIILKPYNTKSKSLTLLIDRGRLKKEGWDVMQPYNGLSQVTVSDCWDKVQTLILLSCNSFDEGKRYYFPFAAFTIKK